MNGHAIETPLLRTARLAIIDPARWHIHAVTTFTLMRARF